MKMATGVVAAVVLAWGASSMGAERKGEASSSEIVGGANQFTVDLYRAIAGEPGNVFASPLNVATALGMTALGAKGETAGQMAKALHLPADGSPAALGTLAEALKGAIVAADGSDAGVSTANAGWFDESESILPEYADRLRESFGSEPHRVDFRNSRDAALKAINGWVADQTRDKIRDLLKPDHVGPDTSLVLTSAIHFKGYWRSAFDPKRTKDGTFHAADGPAPARLMNLPDGRLHYREDDEVQAVTMLYKDGTLGMLVVLPKAPDGLAAVEAGLTAEKIREWATNARLSTVNLTLPRFRSTAEFDLVKPLQALGMTDAFDPSKADFSGINGRRDLAVSAVVHKAFVEVEEKGTEAAAATGVAMTRSSAIARPPVVFRADRPFLYLIRDNESGAILFIGRLAKP
ncbi:serpin family protein [Paludisphaera sp.]|uniref:serpin family protein n=1 Tax=Paludisphaera sp. TaxID=2017432 RepID=UPI00301C601B